MKHKYVFLSSVPRSGSTVLCNLLAQNPKFHATATSGLLDILFNIRNSFSSIIEHKATPPAPEVLPRVLRSVMDSYYEHVTRPIIIEKSRGWAAYPEFAENILGYPPKFLVTTRPLPNILASFEKMYRKKSATSSPPGEKDKYFQFQTAEGRCDYLLRNDCPVGLAINRIKDLILRYPKEHIHFIEYSELTTNPRKKIREIYEFLQEPIFKHDIDNIEQVTYENDEVHGWTNDLHTIRQRLEPGINDAIEILGEKLVTKYSKII